MLGRPEAFKIPNIIKILAHVCIPHRIVLRAGTVSIIINCNKTKIPEANSTMRIQVLREVLIVIKRVIR